MDYSPERDVLVQRLSVLCLVLSFAVVALSAYLRLSKSVADVLMAAAQEVAAARLAHRVAASVLLVLALLLVGATRRDRSPRRALAAGLLAVVLGLALLGAWARGSVATGVVAGNWLGGLALVATSSALVASARVSVLTGDSRHARARAWRWWAAALALVLAQAGLEAAGGASGWVLAWWHHMAGCALAALAGAGLGAAAGSAPPR